MSDVVAARRSAAALGLDDPALAGLGLAWVPADLVAKQVAAGRLVPVLDDWAATCPGYHLFHAGRHASPAVTLVVDALRLHKV